jgi:methylmalonyl-CoA mutase cobalamin-binding subunit
VVDFTGASHARKPVVNAASFKASSAVVVSAMSHETAELRGRAYNQGRKKYEEEEEEEGGGGVLPPPPRAHTRIHSEIYLPRSRLTAIAV